LVGIAEVGAAVARGWMTRSPSETSRVKVFIERGGGVLTLSETL
jgi:hypothetical protein